MADVKILPFLRWAGSKRKQVPRLAQFWHGGYTRYVEPFAGCAALYFWLAPSVAMLGDINHELIDAFESVRENPDHFHTRLSALPQGRESYYRIRARDPKQLSPFDRAVRFVYLNRFCFNGIFRTNLAGKFNVPFGGRKRGVIPSIETFRKCAQLLKGATLRSSDFGHVLRDTKKGDFVYLDPPFTVENRRVFREYGPREFRKDDLSRLALHLQGMDRRGVAFVISYADCAEARQLLAPWPQTRVRVRRHVAGFAHARRNAYELIATNIDQ